MGLTGRVSSRISIRERDEKENAGEGKNLGKLKIEYEAACVWISIHFRALCNILTTSMCYRSSFTNNILSAIRCSML